MPTAICSQIPRLSTTPNSRSFSPDGFCGGENWNRLKGFTDWLTAWSLYLIHWDVKVNTPCAWSSAFRWAKVSKSNAGDNLPLEKRRPKKPLNSTFPLSIHKNCDSLLSVEPSLKFCSETIYRTTTSAWKFYCLTKEDWEKLFPSNSLSEVTTN